MSTDKANRVPTKGAESTFSSPFGYFASSWHVAKSTSRQVGIELWDVASRHESLILQYQSLNVNGTVTELPHLGRECRAWSEGNRAKGEGEHDIEDRKRKSERAQGQGQETRDKDSRQGQVIGQRGNMIRRMMEMGA